jgi:hypothetical protein
VQNYLKGRMHEFEHFPIEGMSVLGKITNTQNSISCVCRVEVDSTKPMLLVYGPLIFNCNPDACTNICLSTASNMYRYQNINPTPSSTFVSLSKLDSRSLSQWLWSAVKKSLGTKSSCVNDVACCKIELVFHA